MEGNNKGNQVLLIVIGIATLLMAVVGATFAYFTATATTDTNAEQVNIKTATLGITYNHGAGVNLVEPALIADNDTYVPFSVQNTGTVATNWLVRFLPATTNTIVAEADLTDQIPCVSNLTLDEPAVACTSENVRSDFTYSLYKVTVADATAFANLSTGDTEEEKAAKWAGATLTPVTLTGTGFLADVSTATNTVIKNGLTIAANTTEFYVLKVHFEYLSQEGVDEPVGTRSSRLQNYQQGKQFVGSIEVAVDGTGL